MDVLKKYLLSHPQNLKDWFDQFPWDDFDAEITVREGQEEKMVIAKRVTLQPDAEITGLLVCQDAEIGEGAEVLGTMVCDKGRLGRDVECNYLMGRMLIIGEDAEVRSAMISDSLTMENGAEVDELETLDYALIDVHHEAVVKQRTDLSDTDFNKAIAQRLHLVLESAIHTG